MSNQSPYSPSNGFGAPTPSGRTPPGKASMAGLVAAVVSVALVCTAAVVALVLTLGDDGSAGGTADKTDHTAESSTGSPTTDESSNTPTPDANTVVGAGYSYKLPGGWSDVTDDAGGLGADGSIDTVAAWGSRFQGARANFIVTTTGAGSTTTARDLMKPWRASLKKELGAKPTEIASVTVDGNEAVGLRFERLNESDVPIVQLAYLTVNDGKAYTLGMSTTPDSESDTKDALDAIVETWSWN